MKRYLVTVRDVTRYANSYLEIVGILMRLKAKPEEVVIEDVTIEGRRVTE
jgi:hypothetical protein